MIFSSIEFLTLFLPAFLAIYALCPKPARNATLLIGSWIFYGWWSPAFLLLLIGVTALAWAGGLVLDRLADNRSRKWVLVLLIVINAATLFWFKYINILIETLSDLIVYAGGMSVAWQQIVLPIGLSFFILQSISYLVDVYRREVQAQRRFVWFGAYLAMFGQLIAGPIIRYEWVERELASRPFCWNSFALGARRFMVGMCMKVLIADTLSPLVETAFALPEPTFMDAWLACLAYSLQLFFDFAGYSAMAIGLGQMLGFRFPENFNHPYLANSIQDFWRRWHISLSSWIRDYLYIPLGGNRKGSIRTYANLITTMAIAGMWHGSDNWNFLVWGLLHGFALATARIWSRSSLPAIPGLISRAGTLLFVCMAWVVFRATDFESALSLYRAQIGMQGWALGEALRTTLQSAQLVAIALGLACIVAPLARDTARRLTPGPVLAFADLWPVFGFVLAMALIASRQAVPFLYFQF
ncbi:MBOAT family O-acyltransferase [Orrella marina]|uniref:Probable alginate O-acetylase AlgI n=1 Tax=Orrella marina TaxID=2163011 RepID=A0A2R4XM04_9BURK|nr:MBOAT family protein [Orrella marina]AWB34826.1 MBOAT family protein [Orrella marina]